MYAQLGTKPKNGCRPLLGLARAGNRSRCRHAALSAGLLWLEQGRSSDIGAPARSARRTLEEVLAGEVGTITGGRRTSVVVREVEEKQLAELLTATRRPTGRLAQAQQADSKSREEVTAARNELAQFEGVLDRLEAKRNELRRLMSDLEDPEESNILTSLEADIGRARLAAQSLRTAELVLREATTERSGLQTRAATRASVRASLQGVVGATWN